MALRLAKIERFTAEPRPHNFAVCVRARVKMNCARVNCCRRLRTLQKRASIDRLRA